MKIKSQNHNNIEVVELQGEFTGDFVKRFQDSLTDLITAKNKGIVLDMSDTSFIDSEGLEQLLWLRDYCDEKNCQLKLAALDENTALILQITRLEDQFDRYSELGEAIRSFA